MQKSETIFWGLVVVAVVYLAADYSLGLDSKAIAQSQPAQNQPTAMQGMGCMAKGGGCGCGGMMKKN